MYSPHCPRRNKTVSFPGCLPLRILLIRAPDDRLCLQKRHIVFFQNSRRHFGKLHRADNGIDVVFDQTGTAFVHGHGPGVFAVEGNIFPKQLLDRFAFGNHKAAKLLSVFNFCLSPFGLFLRLKRLPFLLSPAVFRVVKIDDIVPILLLNN